MITDATSAAQQTMQVWPESVSGWVALFTSIAALLGIAVAYGRSIETMNGVGQRVDVLEEAKQRNDGAELERIRLIDRVLNQHEELLRQITEAKAAATQARSDGEGNSRAVQAALSDMTRQMNKMEVAIVGRLSAVEAKLEMR